MFPPSLFFLFFSFLFFLFFYWCRLRRNKKQTAVINIRKYKRKKKDFNLTFHMFQTCIFSSGSSPLLIFRLNGSPKGWVKSFSRPSTLLTCRSEFTTAYMHRIESHLFLMVYYCSLLGLEKFTPMTMTFVDKKKLQLEINKSLLIFQMLMSARSTPMTVTPMQPALTQKAHLLASVTWMHITLVTGKHALLIVSRIMFYFILILLVLPLCQLLTSTLWEKVSTNIYVAKERPLTCLSIILIMLLSKNILFMKFQTHHKRDFLTYFLVASDFRGSLILSVF